MGCSTKPNICGTIYLELEDHYMVSRLTETVTTAGR
jgi:hypothetical protein